jgi:hypothetical protein
MTALARQQQALLAALFAWPPEAAIENMADCTMDARARGLKTYQANGHALAHRALGAAYPVLAQLLGEDSFAALARAAWHAQPPTRGDVAHWGAGLPEFLAASEQLSEEPYLADVARVEWALHRCASAADAEADPASFSLLMGEDPSELVLRLAPGCALVQSAWPVASIVSAHQQVKPDFETVGQRLGKAIAESVVIWREGLRPSLREAAPGEATFLLALLQQQTLDRALDLAPALDFNRWLPLAVQTGLLLGVRPAALGRALFTGVTA